jgi:proliferating cell nuclear antigen PCNA
MSDNFISKKQEVKGNQGFLFNCKTQDAFVIKTLGELLSNRIIFAPFRITEKGIFLVQMDARKEQLVEICLLQENFSPYKCVKPITFNVNTTHLYKMLKCIKKKDAIRLFIHEDDPLNLGICVEQGSEGNRINTYIRITPAHPEKIECPDGYESPIIIPSKQFQKMKNLHNISDKIMVTSKLNYIKFFCDGGELYSRELVIGNENDEDNAHIKAVYKQEFNTSSITGLTKCAGLSGNVQVFVHDDLGIKIKMKAGDLGDVTVYIKSKELLQEEEEDEETPEQLSKLTVDINNRNDTTKKTKGKKTA